jgi:hypothetical protein
MIGNRQDLVLYLIDLHRSPFGIPVSEIHSLVYGFQKKLDMLLPVDKRYHFEVSGGKLHSKELQQDIHDMMKPNGYIEKVNERDDNRKYDWRIKTTQSGNLKLSAYKRSLDDLILSNGIDLRDLLEPLTA